MTVGNLEVEQNSLKQKLLRVWQYFSTILGVIFRHPIVAVTVIALNERDEIVLIQRRDNKKWCCPGGTVDWGESIPDAAKRELKEETGLLLTSVKVLQGVYSDPHRDPRLHTICITLIAEVSGAYKVEDVGEVMQVRSFPCNALPLNSMAHDHALQLQDYLDGKTSRV